MSGSSWVLPAEVQPGPIHNNTDPDQTFNLVLDALPRTGAVRRRLPGLVLVLVGETKTNTTERCRGPDQSNHHWLLTHPIPAGIGSGPDTSWYRIGPRWAQPWFCSAQ